MSTVLCPHCGKRLRLPELHGPGLKCPACRNKFRVSPEAETYLQHTALELPPAPPPDPRRPEWDFAAQPDDTSIDFGDPIAYPDAWYGMLTEGQPRPKKTIAQRGGCWLVCMIALGIVAGVVLLALLSAGIDALRR